MIKPIFSDLFESFESITSDTDGSAHGISSPYIQPAESQVAAIIDDLEAKRKYIDGRIVKMYTKYQYHITLMKTMDMLSFKQFSSRILATFKHQQRPIFTDALIAQKLADILTYCYSTIAPKDGFEIYTDINQAKKMASMTFSRAKVLGLDFLGPDVEDLLKIILFKVFHKLDRKDSTQ